MNDNVNNPSHYTSGKIEVIDFIEDKKLNFNKGNAIKYVSRAGLKDKLKEVEDLEKAIWYLKREITILKGVNSPQLEVNEVKKTICTSTLCPKVDECKRVVLNNSSVNIYQNFEYTCNANSGFNMFL